MSPFRRPCSRGSVINTANCYGLDGPDSNPGRTVFVSCTVCFNLYCVCCNLVCNVLVCVCVCVLVICVLVFTVFCLICTVFFVLFRLCFVCTSVRTTATG
jgi:hypothetical protein